MPFPEVKIKVIRGKKVFVDDRGSYTDYIKIRAYAVTNIHISMGGLHIFVPDEQKNNIRDLKDLSSALESIEFSVIENMLPFDGTNYFIPGTSVKGAIRFRAEMMFKSVDGKAPSCYIVYNSKDVPTTTYRQIWGDQIFENRWRCEVNPKKEKYQICEVCDIFGAPGAIAKVSFSNLIPIHKNFEPSYVEINGEAIQVFPKDTIFEGKIYYNSLSLEPYQLGLLLRAMRIPERKPILIGKYKYKSPLKGANFGLLRFEIIGSSNENFSETEVVKAFDESALGKTYYRWDLNETKIFGF